MRLLLPEPGRSLDERVDLEEVYATPAHPYLRANFVVSLDGAVELDGQSAALGAPSDMALFATLRALTDVVLVGAGTVRAEHYGPAKVAPEAVERRRRRGQTPIPPIAVVSLAANLDPAGLLFSRQPSRGEVPPRPIILTCEAAPTSRRDRLAEVADVILCGDGSVDVAVAVAALRSRGLAQVLCEGGPLLLTSLVAAQLVDELCLTHAPVLAGAANRSLLVEIGPEGEQIVRWSLASLAEGDGLLFGRYRLETADPLNAAAS